MFARKLAVAIAVCAMLAVGSVSYGVGFDATWQMTTDVANPAAVPAGAEITVTIACTAQGYTGSEPGDNITRINVSWLDSTPALLDELAAGAWVWDDALTDLDFEVVTVMTDKVVYRLDAAGITPAASYGIGTLTFDAPMENGTYTIDIGYVHEAPDTTLFGDGNTRRYKGDGLTLTGDGEFGFTVVPEPTTMVLLGAGFAVTLIRRRRTR